MRRAALQHNPQLQKAKERPTEQTTNKRENTKPEQTHSPGSTGGTNQLITAGGQEEAFKIKHNQQTHQETIQTQHIHTHTQNNKQPRKQSRQNKGLCTPDTHTHTQTQEVLWFCSCQSLQSETVDVKAEALK